MREYIINFWVWWYLVKVPEWGREVARRIIFVLEYTNTLTMARNLTLPLFQDNSGIGKMLAILIRGTWVWLGGMFSAVIAIPLLILFVILVFLPLITLWQIVWGLLQILSV
ncbi:hypothetical protein KC640_02375 [Candidatus Dojkabacteria bacterium]|uniref:Uncharacterized protein n=1 Tax=Candidatus Dojkabacteria bacterium TaxID=2099670 RepID=A0A955I7P2_9BACT|nr:hypothetical protein [Candidatus Dojkabacteria bacterium]